MSPTRSPSSHPSLSALRLPALLTPIVFLVHGYHPFANDADIYVAGIRHILNPALYPLNAVFVTAFTHFSIFAWVLAGLVRLLHLPLPALLLVAQLASIFLFLLAGSQVAARLFASQSARRCSILLAAGAFTLPIAGTALFLMDPYLTPRSFSAPLSLFALAACMDRAWARTLLLLALTASLHPLMGIYASALVLLYALAAAGRIRLVLLLCAAAVAASQLALALNRIRLRATPVSAAYRQAVSLQPRSFLFLARWHWYEILGLLLPLLLLAAALRPSRTPGSQRTLCLACILLGATTTLIAAISVPVAGPYLLVPLQVLRSFHLIYAAGVLLCGGVLDALLTRSRIAASLLIVLLFAGMYAVQLVSWPDGRHVEGPGQDPANPWQQAFLWIRSHTPENAVFAFNPKLVYLPGEDEQGFRAIAERDHLTDDKDAGIAAVMPSLAARWAAQRNPELYVDQMSDTQRTAKLKPLGATWLLLPPTAATTFPCPYRNQVVKACKMAP